MANVKVNFMSTKRGEFEKFLRQHHKNKAQLYIKEISNDLRYELNKTVVGTNEGFRNAQPKVVSKIAPLKQGIFTTIRIFMSDGGSSQPHYIWHIINGGRAPGGRAGQAYAKKPVRFPLYKGGARTTPRNLNVRAFGGYSGEWRSFKQGAPMPGIKPREFYRALAVKLRQKHKTKKYRDYELSKVTINNG